MITLKNPTTGDTIQADTGISISSLFLGGLPALFRGDIDGIFIYCLLIFTPGYFEQFTSGGYIVMLARSPFSFTFYTLCFIISGTWRGRKKQGMKLFNKT